MTRKAKEVIKGCIQCRSNDSYDHARGLLKSMSEIVSLDLIIMLMLRRNFQARFARVILYIRIDH